MVALCRAAAFSPKLVIMDEPTGTLPDAAGQRPLKLIRRFPSEGTDVMLVSHRLSDMVATCERVYVVRHGEITDCVIGPTTSEAYLLNLIEAARDVCE